MSLEIGRWARSVERGRVASRHAARAGAVVCAVVARSRGAGNGGARQNRAKYSWVVNLQIVRFSNADWGSSFVGALHFFRTALHVSPPFDGWHMCHQAGGTGPPSGGLEVYDRDDGDHRAVESFGVFLATGAGRSAAGGILALRAPRAPWSSAGWRLTATPMHRVCRCRDRT